MGKCSVPKCTKSTRYKTGVCEMHDKRMKRHGDYDYKKTHTNVGNKCLHIECDKVEQLRGFCRYHYYRAGTNSSKCSISGCTNGHYAKGKCHKHWYREYQSQYLKALRQYYRGLEQHVLGKDITQEDLLRAWVRVSKEKLKKEFS